MRIISAVFALALVAAACGDDSQAPATVAGAQTPGTTAAGTTAPPTTPLLTATTTPPTAAPTTAPAPEPGWEMLAPSGPGTRRDAALTVAPDGTVWLHGGRRHGTPLGDLWRFDPVGATWTEVPVSGPVPANRFGHLAEWDITRDRLVVATGQRGGSEFFSDAWAFDPVTGTWSEIAPAGTGPSERYGSCSALDAATNSLILTHGFTVFGRFDDTWALDLATGEWSELSPDGIRPEARCLHSCEIDPATGHLVLFGGQSNSTKHLGDTWRLSETGWELIDNGTPGARRFPSLTAARGGIHLFGGIGPEGNAAAPFVLIGGTWEPHDLGAGPAPRNGHAAAADHATGTIYVFGGEGPEGELDDLWALTPPTP